MFGELRAWSYSTDVRPGSFVFTESLRRGRVVRCRSNGHPSRLLLSNPGSSLIRADACLRALLLVCLCPSLSPSLGLLPLHTCVTYILVRTERPYSTYYVLVRTALQGRNWCRCPSHPPSAINLSILAPEPRPSPDHSAALSCRLPPPPPPPPPPPREPLGRPYVGASGVRHSERERKPKRSASVVDTGLGRRKSDLNRRYGVHHG